MSSILIFVIVAVAVLVIGLVVGLVAFVNGRKQPRAPRPALVAPSGTITEERPRRPRWPSPSSPNRSRRARGAGHHALERPEGTAGRLVRLRQRLSRSQGGLGRGLLMLLSRDRLDEDTWEEIEDTLITADVGVAPTQELVERLRTRMRVEGVDASTASHRAARGAARAGRPGDGPQPGHRPGTTASRPWCWSWASTAPARPPRSARSPACWSRRTRRVVLGAADTFRAAATEQLSTWGERVGVDVVTGPEGSRPGERGLRVGAHRRRARGRRGRHRHRRPAAEQGRADGRARQGQAGGGEAGPVTEVLLVLDATTGQNGMVQARVFRDVVDVTGIVLTKLDGSAKGGIVVAVQRELGVPVKLVGRRRGRRRPGAVRPRDVRGRPARPGLSGQRRTGVRPGLGPCVGVGLSG